MTIDEAIKHAKKVAEVQEEAAKEWHENQVRKYELIPFAEMDYTRENECIECAKAYEQLVGWLTELKQLREQESVLDKITAEIDNARFIDKDTKTCKNALASGLEVALRIIDKYK